MKRLPSRRRMKKELSRKLMYYPLLRMLLFKAWFRVAFLCILVIVGFLALFVPKMWLATPDGFEPVIKISWLDRVQAWSLSKTARRETEAGNFNDAAYSWQAAIANNPTSRDLLRSFIDTAVRAPALEPKYVRSAVGNSLWLCRLSGTNDVDLDLSVQLYDRYRYYDVVLAVLSSRTDKLTPIQEAGYLKALFHQGQAREFNARWSSADRTTVADPQLPLYKAAYLAGWTKGTESAEAREQLDKAVADKTHSLVAKRLLLAVAAQLNDVDRYAKGLRQLEESNADSLVDHVFYWRLMAASGRLDEAKELAKNFKRLPSSSNEHARLAEAMIRLGMIDEAREILAAYASQSGDSPEIWNMYGTLLVAEKRWGDVRSAALQIRQHPLMRETLSGFSFYLEGLAELGQERKELAADAFERAATAGIDNPTIALTAGKALTDAGFAAAGSKILDRVKKQQGESSDFWEAAFKAALASKDETAILEASTRLYELTPSNAININRYAAALLLNRQKPDVAVKLTLQLISYYPGSSAAQINHAIALLMNQRNEEALEILAAVNPSRLGPSDMNSYRLAWLEVQFNMKRFQEAARLADEIETEYLFPVQVRWLDEMRRRIQGQLAAK